MRQIPSIPNPNCCETYDSAKDVVGFAIARRIREKNIKAADVAKRYPGIRAADIRNFVNGDHRLYGFARICALAEAMGVGFEIKVSA